MADKRINALTTTASSTASDDFFAVDGTTNGTRKLNAFSPTFGGNATVTGTLSSGGNLSVTSTSAQVILGQSSGSQLSYLIRPAQAGGAIQIVQDSATTARYLSLGRADNNGVYVESMRLNDAGVVSIPATTASTSTSNGALVVSGGVGVAGTIYAGGTIRVVGSSHTTRFRRDDAIIDFSNTAENAYVTGTISGNTLELKGNNGTGLTIGTTGNATFAGTLTLGAITTPRGKLDSQQTYNGAAPSTSATPIIRANNGGAISLWTCGQGYDAMWLQAIQDDGANLSKSLLINPLGSNVELGSTSSQVLVKGTTASTSTSTGALVVSGGVGVAKELYIGGLIESSDAAGIRVRTASGTAAKLSVIQTGNATWEMQSIASSSDFAITANSTTDAFRVTTAGNATLAGSVKTSAPSGGTAAAWKLGTVATVSPTSPNRTIEVDIGGTIYYLHAKTTNN